MTSISAGKSKIQIVLVLLFWLAVWQLAAYAIGQDLFLVSPVKVIWILFGQIQGGRILVYCCIFLRANSGFRWLLLQGYF